MNILNRIIAVTGIYRDQVAEHFGVTSEQVAHWEVDISTIPMGLLAPFVEDFYKATTHLDHFDWSWDSVIAFRNAARGLKVSPYTLSFMLARRGIEPMDFGTLGLWITIEEMAACRRL